MSDNITDLESVSLRDQVDAHWRTVSEATARHYITLTDAGVSPRAAAKLCRDFQGMLLEPDASEVHVIMQDGD